jgi:hypothetical protein
MFQRSAIVVALLAAALGVGSKARAQGFPGDLTDQTVAVDELVLPEEPRPSPKPYESPLGRAYFVTDVVGFERDSSSDNAVAALNGTVVLDADDIDFVHQPGVRALVGIRLNNFVAVEASYLGLLDWDESETIRNASPGLAGIPGDLDSPLSNFGIPVSVVGLDFNHQISERVITTFNTAELNLRRRLPMPYCTTQMTGLAGVRYMQIDDEFQFRSRSFLPLFFGAAQAVDVQAENRLIGPQLGGALELHIERRAWLNLEAKGAMLYNEAQQATTYTAGTLVVPAIATTGGGSDGSRIAFAVDLQATLVWKFNPAIVGRVGYQALIMNGLALGSENFAENAPTIPAGDFSGFSDSGDLIFHGPFTGVTFTW